MKKIIHILFVGIIFILSGCKDDLTKEPLYSFSDDIASSLNSSSQYPSGQYIIKWSGGTNPCPNEIVSYYISAYWIDIYGTVAVNIETVKNWKVTGGVKVGYGVDGEKRIDVQWSDATSAEISVEVKIALMVGYPPPSLTKEKITITPYSIKGVNPSAISGISSIYKGEEVQQNYSINPIKYPNGTEIRQYAWVIPAGWKYSGTVSDGNTPFMTSSSSISVVSDKCTGDNISVYGINSWCAGVYSNTSTSSLTIARPWPNFSISGPPAICSSGSSFTLNIPPSEGTIIWNPGDNISLVSDQGSNPCTFAATGSGVNWVEATISTNCGNVTLPKKYLWTGIPPYPIVISDNSWPYIWIDDPFYGAVRKYTVPVGVDIVFYDENKDIYGGLIENFSWTWYLDHGGLMHEEYDYNVGGKMYIFHEPGSFRVRVMSENGCGATDLSAPVYFDVIGEEY